MKSLLRIAAMAAFLGTVVASAEETTEPKPSGILSGVAVLGGLSRATLKLQEDFTAVPVILRLSLDPRPLARSMGFELPGTWAFNVEPFFGQVVTPDHGQLAGCGFFLRWSHSLFVPALEFYLEGGVAPIYMSTRTYEQSTEFNFLDQAGAGFSYALNAQWGVELGYRFWHISNCGIREPNSGIEGHTFLTGLSRRF